MAKFDLDKYWDFRVWVKSQIAQLREIISNYQQNGGGGGTGGSEDFDPNGSYPNLTVGKAASAEKYIKADGTPVSISESIDALQPQNVLSLTRRVFKVTEDLEVTESDWTVLYEDKKTDGSAYRIHIANIPVAYGDFINIKTNGNANCRFAITFMSSDNTLASPIFDSGWITQTEYRTSVPTNTKTNRTYLKVVFSHQDNSFISLSEVYSYLSAIIINTTGQQYVSLDKVLEYGSIYFNGSDIVYQDSPNRARIMRGLLLPLKVGDKIVSTSENIRFFAGTKTFSNAGWKNGIVEYIIPRDDNWSIVMTDYPTEQKTTLSNYEGKIFIKTENHIYLTEYLARMVELQYQTNFDTNIKAINHRGWHDAPENTLVAYRESRKRGFNYVECDVSFTKDGVPVLLHDSTIDRTSNGSGSIANMTYEEVSAFDFGSWKSEKYAGEKIPKLRDFIMLCKHIGLHPYIELKDGAEARIKDVVQIVNSCGMRGKVTYISFAASLLEFVVQTDENARVGLVCNSVTEDTIQSAEQLRTGKNEVFIDSGTATYAEMMLCLNNGYPLEVWTYDYLSNVQSLEGYEYISGVTSNRMIIGKEMLNTSI